LSHIGAPKKNKRQKKTHLAGGFFQILYVVTMNVLYERKEAHPFWSATKIEKTDLYLRIDFS
jgi:hypothetical protein